MYWVPSKATRSKPSSAAAVASPMWIVGIDRPATIVSQTLCSVLQPRMKTSAPARSSACASAASSSPASSHLPAAINSSIVPMSTLKTMQRGVWMPPSRSFASVLIMR